MTINLDIFHRLKFLQSLCVNGPRFDSARLRGGQKVKEQLD
jgi:hypothetical protein